MTRTKGDVIVEEIRIGDIHYYYYENGEGRILKVIDRPELKGTGWKLMYRCLTSKSLMVFFVSNSSIISKRPELYTYKKHGDFW